MSKQSSSRPILVTGAHRTGTTWVGKMLAASHEVAYISEPLNMWHRPGVMKAPVNHWYTYISTDNENLYLPALQDTLDFHYHLRSEFAALHSTKDVLRMLRDLKIFTTGKFRKQRPLLKDPFAVFSAFWFANKLNCQVIITIRHPAAFASSLKRLKWSFDFNDLLKQPFLMSDHLESYRCEMEEYREHPEDIIGQSALLWRMVYQTVDKIRHEDPQIQIIRHEDLSLNPEEGFTKLYEMLDLQYTTQVIQTIRKTSHHENPKELSPNSVHSVKLDSQANISNWKKRLTQQEIIRVLDLTSDVAENYYTEQELY